MTEQTRRIRKVINWLIFCEIAENERDLAEKLGYTKSAFSQIVNGKVPLSDKFLKNLRSLDENINDVWIRTGEGDMRKNDPQFLQKVYGDNSQVAGHDINIQSTEIGKLIETLNLQQKNISDLIEHNHSQIDKMTDIISRMTK